MTTDEDKHLEVMTQLQDLNTKFDEIVKPAIIQVWDNKDNIIKCKSFQSITKYVGGLIITGIMFITFRSIWNWIKHH